MTGQKPKPAGKRRRAGKETAEGSCCAGGVIRTMGADLATSPHANPCLRPVALHLAHLVFLFWNTENTDFIEYTETSSTSKDTVGAVLASHSD